MSRSDPDFRKRYGPWAVVAGASEGLGRAFATELARRGLNLMLVARKEAALQQTAGELREAHGVETAVLALDMGAPDAIDQIADAVGEREVGFIVANAAFVPIGQFSEIAPADLDQAIAVNCRGTLQLARRFLPPMAARGRGGMVVMASMAGLQGTPMLTTYAATKAFDLVLAEGLWQEFGKHGVHVIGSAAGAIADPNLAKVKTKRAPGTLSPDAVVSETLAALGKGPRVVPGRTNKFASVLMSRLLPRHVAVRIMAMNTKDLRTG